MKQRHIFVLIFSFSLSAALAAPTTQQAGNYTWAWQLNDVDHCDGQQFDYNGQIAAKNFTVGSNHTPASCVQPDYPNDHFELHCALSATGELTAAITTYSEGSSPNPRTLGQGHTVQQGCSVVPDFTKYNRPFVGMCCFPATHPPTFPPAQPASQYQTDGTDTREVFSCTRTGSTMCTYPGPMSNWTCSDIPRSLKPQCEDHDDAHYDNRVHRKCGLCALEAGQGEDEDNKRFVTRFCAKDSSSYLLVTYEDGNCEEVSRKISPAVVSLTSPHKCSIEGHCSAVMPKRTCQCMCGWTCAEKGIQCGFKDNVCTNIAGSGCCSAGGGPEQLRGTETWDQIL